MAATTPRARGVLVVDPDARVRTALTALIDATPGLSVVAVCDSGARAEQARRVAVPAVAVVGLSGSDSDVTTISALARHIAVAGGPAAEVRGRTA